MISHEAWLVESEGSLGSLSIPRSWACEVLFGLNIKDKGGTSLVTKDVKRFMT
jgi:hypothetical protein